MEKSATLNVRISPEIKQQAEDVLRTLGIPMATAVDMFLRQVSLTNSIPFPLTARKVPASINADLMSDQHLSTELIAGYDDMTSENVQDAKSAFQHFRKSAQ